MGIRARDFQSGETVSSQEVEDFQQTSELVLRRQRDDGSRYVGLVLRHSYTGKSR